MSENEKVIVCEKISKSYKIGARTRRYSTLRDVLCRPVDIFSAFRRNNTIWALENVSFNVERGEILGMIGRNGAGKTTALKILSRITEPTSGTAQIKGRVGSLLEVGTGFHPELTGRENIYLNGVILGMKKKEIDSKFDEIVAFAEMEKFIDTQVKFFSSGMYVRLAFAVAAFLETEILLVDEVLAVGDMAFQRKCLGRMGDIAKQGRTILFVSHNMGAIKQLCGRVMIFDNGQIAFDGDIESAISNYIKMSDQMEMSGEVDTEKVLRRTGLGEGRINKIEFEDKDRRKTAIFGIGEEFNINIYIRTNRDISNVIVGAEVKSFWDIPLLNLRSDSQGMTFGPFTKDSEVLFTVRVPGLPLYPGTYVIEPWFGQKGDKRQDHIHEDIKISLESKGIYASENILQGGKGLVVMDCGWEARKLR